MRNYHADIILIIDFALLALSLSLTAVVIVFLLTRRYAKKRRYAALLKIKQEVYDLILSGKTAQDASSFLKKMLRADIYVDIASNRNRDAVFFNETEQILLKEIFLRSSLLPNIENTARKCVNKWRRIEAIMALGYSNSPSALKILKQSVNNKDADMVYFSVISLGQIKTALSGRILIDILSRRDFYRNRIASILGGFPQEIVGDLSALLDHKDEDVRFWGLKILADFKPRFMLKKIEAMTKDPSGKVRAAACDCLGGMGDIEAKNTIVNCLKDDLWLVRVSAVSALCDLLKEKCLPEVVRLINDGSLSVIESVKEAIAKYHDKALPFIKNIFQHGDVMAKKIAVEILEESALLNGLINAVLDDKGEGRRQPLIIIKGMISVQAHFGFESVLKKMDRDRQKEFLDILREEDNELARHVESSLCGKTIETL